MNGTLILAGLAPLLVAEVTTRQGVAGDSLYILQRQQHPTTQPYEEPSRNAERWVFAPPGDVSGARNRESTTQPAAAPADPATQPADGADVPLVEKFKQVGQIIGHAGEVRGEVYTLTVPRDDVMVRLENGDVPVEAGLESRFHFFWCPCGKMNVVGQFVLKEYEANDVIDALRKDQHCQVVSVGPMFLGDRPRMVLVRFQGEGRAELLARTLKEALDWTGENRMKPSTQPATRLDD